jgi:hypothetical protein
LGQSGETYRSFEEVRVFFFDLPSESGHQNGLIVGLRKYGESGLTYTAFSGSGSFGDSDMSVTLQANGSDRIVLRSYDVTDGDLDNVIQTSRLGYRRRRRVSQRKVPHSARIR